ncbi:MAG: NAD(P)H-dependent oxidoreductase [Phycisphaerales bacterium]
MAPVSIDTILSQLNWRYATKKFDPTRKIDAATWSKLEQVLVLSPNSYGLQLWKFVVVTDPAVRERLKPASYGQSQVTDASHLVVVCARNEATHHDVQRYINRIAEVRNVPHDSLDEFKNMMLGTVQKPGAETELRNWMDRQTYIAVGFFLEACALLQIDACPMEGISGPQYDEILGLTAEGYHSLCIMTAGYRAADDPFAKFAKVRFPVEHVIKRA